MGRAPELRSKHVFVTKESIMNATINEKRCQFVLSLYLIRKQYTQMGLFQPDFLWVTFRSMMPSKYIRTDFDIQKAVNDWCYWHVKATAEYGHISKWNTSLVTNMKELFQYKGDFNDDISKWNVSNVTDMSYMFMKSQFIGDISGWNVSSVTNMGGMFMNTPFNGDISGWNVSSFTDMSSIFSSTPFDGDISGWNVSSFTNMGWMFYQASFNGDISEWNVSKVTNMEYIFEICPISEINKPNYDFRVED